MSKASKSVDSRPALYPTLLAYLDECVTEFDTIPHERHQELAQLADYVREKRQAGQPARLTFICTHNSRRSHLAQIWAQVAAEYYGVTGVETYSGGTEATAFNPRAVRAMQACGLKIQPRDASAANPVYLVKSSEAGPAQECFSKVCDQAPNPSTAYAAVMTCSQADESCPIVRGCELRIPICYQDPKSADDTPEEASRYAERARQICREMLFAMSLV